MPLAAGAKLGPYEIQSALGAGGMGEVYLAHDTRLDRSVAIKMVLGGWDMEGIPAIDATEADLAAGEQRPEQHAGSLGAR